MTLHMTLDMTMDDWQERHADQAAAQGWCLSEVGLSGTAHCVEIQRIDDAECTSISWGIQIPQLLNDEQAVQAMHTAWMKNEEYALQAYQILKTHSPSEFHLWDMAAWVKEHS